MKMGQDGLPSLLHFHGSTGPILDQVRSWSGCARGNEHARRRVRPQGTAHRKIAPKQPRLAGAVPAAPRRARANEGAAAPTRKLQSQGASALLADTWRHESRWDSTWAAPKSCSAASALWVEQRSVRFSAACPPPLANGTRWWSSSRWVSRQRCPALSMYVQRAPSRSKTARRTRSGMWRDGRVLRVARWRSVSGSVSDSDSEGVDAESAARARGVAP